jgi:SsrA-binding protein
MNAHIAPYEPASRQNHDPRRPRKLLLQRKELARLDERVSQRGYTVVPIQMLLRGGLAKVEIALARGKRKYDKRREIADRDANREVERALRQRSKG